MRIQAMLHRPVRRSDKRRRVFNSNNCRFPTANANKTAYVRNNISTHYVGPANYSQNVFAWCNFIIGNAQEITTWQYAYDFVLSAAIYYNGVIYPVTFNGSKTVTVTVGSHIVCDPVPGLVLLANTKYQVITRTVAANTGLGNYGFIYSTGGLGSRGDGTSEGTDTSVDWTLGPSAWGGGATPNMAAISGGQIPTSGNTLSSGGSGYSSAATLWATPHFSQISTAWVVNTNPVRVVATSNITQSGTQTIDGVALNVGDRVLCEAQTTSANNGIWVVASGAWARDTDLSAWSQGPGMLVGVTEGTSNATTYWLCEAASSGTLGTTSMPWKKYIPCMSVGFTNSPTGGVVSSLSVSDKLQALSSTTPPVFTIGGGGTPGAGAQNVHGPYAAAGIPDRPAPSILLTGDSNVCGFGASDAFGNLNGSFGIYERMWEGLAGMVMTAVSGQAASGYLSYNTMQNDAVYDVAIPEIVLIGLGSNDMATDSSHVLTAQAVAVRVENCMAVHRARGAHRFIIATFLPKTANAASKFTTVAAQQPINQSYALGDYADQFNATEVKGRAHMLFEDWSDPAALIRDATTTTAFRCDIPHTTHDGHHASGEVGIPYIVKNAPKPVFISRLSQAA